MSSYSTQCSSLRHFSRLFAVNHGQGQIKTSVGLRHRETKPKASSICSFGTIFD